VLRDVLSINFSVFDFVIDFFCVTHAMLFFCVSISHHYLSHLYSPQAVKKWLLNFKVKLKTLKTKELYKLLLPFTRCSCKIIKELNLRRMKCSVVSYLVSVLPVLCLLIYLYRGKSVDKDKKPITQPTLFAYMSKFGTIYQ